MSTSSAVARAQLAKVLCEDEQLLKILSAPKEKPLELSKKLFQKCIISDNIKDLFTSLDHSRVDPQLQVRYLLRQVSGKVEEDESVWGRFLSLLTSMGERQLCEYMRTSTTAEARPPVFVDITLTSEDMSLLSEILAQVSHKWEHLGIALSLPKHELENCRRLDNKISLSNVLSYWLSRNDATLNKLKRVLSSKIVGEGRLVQELEERIGQTKNTNIYSSEHKDESDINSFSIINQSYDVEVVDSKSTLLHVQVRPTESLFYQWNKDGQPLANDCTYSGVHDDILVVDHASQGTEGEYTCSVSSQEGEVCSNKITLTILYSPAKKKLLDLYSIRKEVPPDSWPPTGTKSFVNLVLTKSDSECSSELDHVSIGDTDKEMAKTKSKEYKGVYDEVFLEYKSKTLVFIEGRPGSGKTTLVHKIIKDWTKGKALHEAKLVFIVTLRSYKNEESLSSTLSLFFHTDQELQTMISDIESANGDSVCFILDGLDEYKPQDRDKSVIYKLLDKIYLPLAMIIVVSCPAAVETLQQDAITERIEVLGFTRENIIEYIDNFPFCSSSSVSVNLKAYLHSHPNVFDMCYLPVHAAMICFLYNHGKGNLPCTQTKIYEEFTRSMILRHLRRINPSVKVCSLKELTGNTKEYFSALCHLAYNMTVQVKQVVTSDEIDMQLSEDACSDDEWSLGLVTVNQVAQLYGIDNTYSFHHLTFQEFLAAYYSYNRKSRATEDLS